MLQTLSASNVSGGEIASWGKFWGLKLSLAEGSVSSFHFSFFLKEKIKREREKMIILKTDDKTQLYLQMV